MSGLLKRNEGQDRLDRRHARTVYSASILTFLIGVLVALLHRQIETEFAFVLLIVIFSFALSGSLLLFYFLESNAQLKDKHMKFKLGGAAAGFVIFIYVFYRLIGDSVSLENQLYMLATSELNEELLPIVESYSDIKDSGNDSLLRIADEAVLSIRSKFDSLGIGSFRVTAQELPSHLMPMIDNAINRYWATQYVLPETFWSQYWAEEYFGKNVTAFSQRNVDIRRVFILNYDEARAQKELLDNLIERHVSNGIPIRIVFQRELETFTDQNLQSDFVIADEDISAVLILNRDGGFNEVEFSTDRGLIQNRAQSFGTLWEVSMTFEEWREEYYQRWSD